MVLVSPSPEYNFDQLSKATLLNCCVVAKYHTPVGGILMDRVLGIRVATVVFAALILSGQVLYCTVLY